MKKVLILLAVVVFLISFNGGALGVQVKMGFSLSTDVFYSFLSGPAYFGAQGTRDIRQPDLTTGNFQVGDSQLYFQFFSDDKTTGAHVQIGMTAGPFAGAAQVNLTYLYAWYKFEKFRLEIGHTDNLFASSSYAPYGALGFVLAGDGSGGFAEFGKLYSGRFAQVALYYGSGRWTVMAALGMPSINSDNDPAQSANPAVYQFYTMYPRLDLAVEYRGAYFAVAPAFSIYRTRWAKWQDAADLKDDAVLSYAVVLPFKVVIGHFGLTGEIGYALNWVTPTLLNTWQYATWWGGWQDLLSMNKVADTRRYTACLGLYYTVGRTTIWLSAGWQMTQNPSSDVVGSWRHGQNVRYAMILAVPTRVNRHFSIAPEIGYYFYGYNPTEDVGGANPGSLARTSTQADLGSLWIIGIRFAFTF